MQNVYEAPALTLIGEANDIVLGFSLGGDDLPNQLALDFEFEQD